jgi:lipoprotein NlpD
MGKQFRVEQGDRVVDGAHTALQPIDVRTLAHHPSRITHHLLSYVVLAFLAFACASDPPRASGTYTVKKGDTLYSIAWRNGVDYRDLAKWNEIGRDYAIKPGQVLRLTSSKRGASASASKSPAPTPNARAPANVGPPVKWSWPVSGAAVKLTTRPNGGQGLTISGELGQDIRAAAAGRVVYTGTGLLGYGQLVIIKHNDVYLSAYGHTQAVRVREQEVVQAGQTIATMGAGPNGSPMLYFEIRVNGRPTDPTPMLPK